MRAPNPLGQNVTSGGCGRHLGIPMRILFPKTNPAYVPAVSACFSKPFPQNLARRALYGLVCALARPFAELRARSMSESNYFANEKKALPRAVDSHAAHSWLLYPCSFRLLPRLATYVKRDRRTDTFCHGCFTGQGWGSVGMAEAVKWVY